MQEAAQNILLVLVALFPIMDPLGGSSFFLALTREYSPEARKALSWRIAVNSFFLLVATYFVGTSVFAFFGISLAVVQVGGGLIVIATGWTLLKQRDDEKEEVQKTRKLSFRHCMVKRTPSRRPPGLPQPRGSATPPGKNSQFARPTA